MIHYHGTPITPLAVINELVGRNFCVSFAAPEQVKRVHELGQSVMLDNGALSFWKRGFATDWPAYYEWVEPWLDYKTTWAVIPDVIDGTEEENDQLILDWPFGIQGAPVWHLDEPIARLVSLCDVWPRVCLGSSGKYATVGDRSWHYRMHKAMNVLCGDGPAPTWLHMLRGMSLAGSEYPFASVDSTDVARNHNRGGDALVVRQSRAVEKTNRWDGLQCPGRWAVREQVEMEAA